MEFLSAEVNWNLWFLRGRDALSKVDKVSRFNELEKKFDQIRNFNDDQKRVYATLVDGGSPPVPDGTLPATVNFVTLCFTQNPEKRPTVKAAPPARKCTTGREVATG